MTKLLTIPRTNGAIIIEGHIQGLSNTRSLGEAGIPVYVVDKNSCIASYSKYCTKFFKSPDFIKDEFVDFLIELAVVEDIKNWVLIPSNDHAVYSISKHKERLEKYYKVITPKLDIIQNIYDKALLLEIAIDINVSVPVTQYFTAYTDRKIPELQFPVLTKGRNGLSFYKGLGKKAFLSNNEQELRTVLKYIDSKYPLSETFTQELIPNNNTNKTVSVAGFAIKGDIKSLWMGEKIREHPLLFGTATYCKSVYYQELIDPSEKLLETLNYTGVCEIEYLKDSRDGIFKLIEINARTWLWVGLANACGVDFTLMLYNFSQNIKNEFPNCYLKDLYWINSVTDTFFSLKALIRNKLSFTEYLTSLKRKKVYAVYSSNDKIPALILPFLIFLRALNKKN